VDESYKMRIRECGCSCHLSGVYRYHISPCCDETEEVEAAFNYISSLTPDWEILGRDDAVRLAIKMILEEG
jgi:hypothetical protein